MNVNGNLNVPLGRAPIGMQNPNSLDHHMERKEEAGEAGEAATGERRLRVRATFHFISLQSNACVLNCMIEWQQQPQQLLLTRTVANRVCCSRRCRCSRRRPRCCRRRQMAKIKSKLTYFTCCSRPARRTAASELRGVCCQLLLLLLVDAAAAAAVAAGILRLLQQSREAAY